jgi:hypothetical protein
LTVAVELTAMVRAGLADPESPPCANAVAANQITNPVTTAATATIHVRLVMGTSLPHIRAVLDTA